MNCWFVRKRVWLYLLVCVVLFLPAGGALAEEGVPPSAGPVSQESAVVMVRPDTPTYSVDVPKSPQQSFAPGDGEQGLMSWTTLLDEDFETTFPYAGWEFSSNPNGTYIWGTDTYRSYSADKSVYPGAGGTLAYDPRYERYNDNMNAWMTYGPMDLSTAADARLEFRMIMATQTYLDALWVCASVDNATYYCNNWSGGTMTQWDLFVYSFSDWPGIGSMIGYSTVWIGFVFASDGSTTEQGVFIDDVLVRATSSSAEPDLHPYSEWVMPNLYHPGDSIPTYSQFYNLGLADCVTYDVTEYLSTDAVITSGDIEIGTASYVGPINPREFGFTIGSSVIPDPTPPGMYYVGVIYSCTGDTETSNDTAVYPNQIEVTAVGTNGIIFQDFFEGADFSSWTRFNPGRTGLSVCSEAAITEVYGACFFRPPGNDKRRQLIDETPVNQTTFWVRFRFDINGLSMSEGERFRFMQVKMGPARPFFIVLKYQGGQYWIQLNTLLDDFTKDKTTWIALSDAPHMIEVSWKAASAPGANDGYAGLILDGVDWRVLLGLDNDTIYVDTFKIGYTSRLEGKSISGVFYVDDVITNNEAYTPWPGT